jgi:hypothetical protein
MSAKAASWGGPLVSFGIAVALSVLAGGTHHFLIARQSGGGTDCSCNLKVMSVSDFLGWSTTTAKDSILKSIAVAHSITVCASSKPQGLAWDAQWSAANLSVAYVVKIAGFPDVIVPGAVFPIPYLKLSGTCPCMPAQETMSNGHPIHLGAFHTAAVAAIKAQLAPLYPKGTVFNVTITSISFKTNQFNAVVALTGGCSPAPTPVSTFITAFATPKNVGQGNVGPIVTVVNAACP